MKTISTSIPKVWLMLAGLLWLAFMGLVAPLPVDAGPALGITVTPTPTTDTTGQGTPTPTPDGQATPTPNPGGGTSTPDDDQDTSVIDVQFGCTNICPIDGQALVVSGRVQLIHRGSGWIAEGVISNQSSTQFQVPYPGEYEVYLIEPLADGLEMSGSLPLFLGVVETNSGLQLTDCPANCPPALVEPTPLPPLILPATGDPSPWYNLGLTLFLLIGGLVIAGVSLFRLTRRHKA